MENWVRNKLVTCLPYEVPDDLVEYILKIKEEHQLDSIRSFLDENNEQHVVFLSELKQKLFPKSLAIINSQAKPFVPKNNKNSKKYEKKQKSSQQLEEEPSISTGAKKKSKFYNFYGQDGQTNDIILLKGRHLCECQASKHKLINNCLSCGRIVCEQEGSGPCLFCGNLVCTEEENQLINTNSKKGENLKKSLLEQGKKAYELAVAQRDRLLEYDKQSERRTTVIDDESDYFKANSVWLSDDEKKKLEKLEKQLQEHKHASRLNRKMTFDFAGRQIVEEDSLTKELEEQILRQVLDGVEKKDFLGNVHPEMEYDNPVFVESINKQFPILKKVGGNFDGVYNRVQDKEFLEMSDLKSCLSMHQPWASLLIAGIKMHEGRTWYSAHRGKLWIASTAKPVNMDEVETMQRFYQLHKKDFTFPSQYPSGVLLGSVLVKDCLPQEEYRKIYPDGESTSPYVFICEHPEELPIKFPIKGEHKIYKLDPNIHTAAVKALQKVRHNA